MPQEAENKTLNNILLAIIAGLLLVIIVGTIAGLLRKKEQKPENLISQGKAVSLMAPSNTDEVSYFELGTIRVSTSKSDSEEGGAIMVLSPWLAYPAGDTVFFEELSRKRLLISGIITNYFSTHTKNQLLQMNEDKIKSELLDQINSQLSLGKIVQIYFTDYIFLE